MEAPPQDIAFDPARACDRGYHFRETVRLAWPVVVSQLSHTMVQLADAYFVGNTGSEDALATISFANAVFVIVLVTGIGLTMGLTPLVAQAMGKGHEEGYLGKLLANSLFLNLSVGLGLSMLLVGLVPLLPYFGQSEAVTRLSGPVLSILAASLIPVMGYQALRQWMEGQGLPNLPMAVSIGANGVNILLNWVLVYGNWGAAPMGVNGSALATLIARLLMVAGMAAIVFTQPNLRPNLPKSWTWDNLVVRQLAKLGLPVALQLFFEVGAFAYAAIMVGWLGSVQQSAHQVAIAVASFTYMGANGLSAAGTVRVGYYYGARLPRALNLAANTTYLLGLAYMLLAAGLLMVFKEEIPYLFFPYASVAEPAALLLFYAAIFQLADGAQVVGLGVLRGMGDVRIPTAIAAISYWVAAIPIGYWIGFRMSMGAGGVWIGLTIGLFLAAIALYGRYLRRQSAWAQSVR